MAFSWLCILQEYQTFNLGGVEFDNESIIGKLVVVLMSMSHFGAFFWSSTPLYCFLLLLGAATCSSGFHMDWTEAVNIAFALSSVRKMLYNCSFLCTLRSDLFLQAEASLTLARWVFIRPDHLSDVNIWLMTRTGPYKGKGENKIIHVHYNRVFTKNIFFRTCLAIRSRCCTTFFSAR